jgi:tetratricopeptide (TPR) repeat protein
MCWGGGLLSIKATFNGRTIYRMENGMHAVDEHCYLILNADRDYDVIKDSYQPVETLSVYFEPHFAEDTLRAIQGKTEHLLDDPMQYFREQQDNPKATHIARWCVARTMREMGQVEVALDIQHVLETDGVEDGFVSEEIGECLYAIGKVQEAKPYFQKAYELLSMVDWVVKDAKRMERLRELSA